MSRFPFPLLHAHSVSALERGSDQNSNTSKLPDFKVYSSSKVISVRQSNCTRRQKCVFIQLHSSDRQILAAIGCVLACHRQVDRQTTAGPVDTVLDEPEGGGADLLCERVK